MYGNSAALYSELFISCGQHICRDKKELHQTGTGLMYFNKYKECVIKGAISDIKSYLGTHQGVAAAVSQHSTWTDACLTEFIQHDLHLQLHPLPIIT